MENVPPLSPVKITATSGAPEVLQRLEGSYCMVADGALVIITLVLVSNPGQGGEAAMLYFTVCVPTVLVAGEIKPVVLSIVKPASPLNVPPCVPVITTGTFPSDEHIGGY